MKKEAILAIAAGFVFLGAGCGGAHPKLEETKESGEKAGVAVKTDADAMKAFQDAAAQQQQEVQQTPPAQ
ncbi:MAG: hypothetical protein HUU46_24165 [Candidatus Hydrogenedentes bacterium]|nr:hypothetical protein [Candidatus Hydrogenedentota bacterium]